MKITIEDIINNIKIKEDKYNKILLLRLYDEYKKIDISEKNNNENEIDLLKINNAYENINKKIKKLDLNNNQNIDEIIKKEIYTQNELLSICLLNFDKKNKLKINTTLETITNLECLLSIPVSFPEKIENCILKQFNNNKEQKYELQSKELKRMSR